MFREKLRRRIVMFTLIVLLAIFSDAQCSQLDINSPKHRQTEQEHNLMKELYLMERRMPILPFPWSYRHLPRFSYGNNFVRTYELRRRIEDMKRIQDEILAQMNPYFTGFPMFEDDDEVPDLSHLNWYQQALKEQKVKKEKETVTKKIETQAKTENASKEEESTKETKSQETTTQETKLQETTTEETNDKTETPLSVTVTENIEKISEVEENVTEKEEGNNGISTEIDNDAGKQIVEETEENSTNSAKAAPEVINPQQVSEIGISQETLTTEENFNIQKEDGQVVFEDSRAGKFKFPES